MNSQFAQNQRREILKLLPASYQSQFEHVEPRKMEEMGKPLDEKRMARETKQRVVMSLLDKQEIKPKVVNVMLLDNEEQNKIKENVIIEEINEEEEEEEGNGKEKHGELETEGLRKRKGSAHCLV